MNVLLSTICLLVLLVILALPLGLIVSQWIADAARERRHQAWRANHTEHETLKVFLL